jgi:hypothetical protein
MGMMWNPRNATPERDFFLDRNAAAQRSLKAARKAESLFFLGHPVFKGGPGQEFRHGLGGNL